MEKGKAAEGKEHNENVYGKHAGAKEMSGGNIKKEGEGAHMEMHHHVHHHHHEAAHHEHTHHHGEGAGGTSGEPKKAKSMGEKMYGDVRGKKGETAKMPANEGE